MTARERLARAARRLPHPVRHAARQVARRRAVRRLARPVRWGTLRQTRPVSDEYGFDRGTPVDRIHLDRFFAAHSADIRGAVLEVGGPVFSGRYGREVTSTDIVDIDPTNGLATVVGDLAVVDVLPTAAFDCIVVPQTLQYVGDPGAAVRNLHEALLPGGVLLLTVPVAARVDSAAATTDAWRFTPVGLRILLDRGCPDAEITVEAAGNVLTVTAFLQGISAEELRAEEFDVHDPAFPLLAMARVRRAAAR